MRILMPTYDPSGQVQLELVRPGLPPLGRPGTAGRQAKNTGDFDVSVGFNAHGFRDRKEMAAATPDDLFAVGDSFTFGWGVEEPERFSDRLAETLGVRVFNVAAPAAHVEEYGRLLLHARGLGAPVRRVVVGLCMENDLAPYPLALREPSRLSALSLAGLKQALAGHSALYFALTTVVQRHDRLRRLGLAAGLIRPTEFRRPGGGGPDLVGRSAEALSRAVTGLDAVVLLIPSRGLWQGPEREAEDRIHRRFVAELAARSLPTVDLRARFEAASAGPLAFHFAHDGHWNRSGHALAAEELAAHPVVRAWVPQPPTVAPPHG